jgi:hypothetical protein
VGLLSGPADSGADAALARFASLQADTILSSTPPLLDPLNANRSIIVGLLSAVAGVDAALVRLPLVPADDTELSSETLSNPLCPSISITVCLLSVLGALCIVRCEVASGICSPASSAWLFQSNGPKLVTTLAKERPSCKNAFSKAKDQIKGTSSSKSDFFKQTTF